MDVGGSDGKLILPLALVCDSLDYYCEDINPVLFFQIPEFSALARKTINPALRFNTHTVTGTDSTIPGANHLFDYIVVRETFHHFTSPEKMLAEFKRLLVPEGTLIISEPANQKKFRQCKLIAPEKLKALATAAGFHIVSQELTKAGFWVYLFGS